MSYQNVSTPRFYVDIWQFAKLTGIASIWQVGWITDIQNLNPYGAQNIIVSNPNGSNGYNDTRVLNDITVKLNELIGENGYVAFLGHNFNSADVRILIQEGTTDYQGTFSSSNKVNFGDVGNHCKPDFDGFSIATCSFGNFD